MAQFNVFSRVDDSGDTWSFRGTTMADNSIEAITNLANEDSTKNCINKGTIRRYAAVRSSYWETHDFKFEITPHRIPKNEVADSKAETV